MSELRTVVESPGLVGVPCCYDALSARVVEAAGSPISYITGYGVAAVLLGAPDAGLASMDEIVGHAGRMADAVTIPLWCDVDQGWGPPHVVARTVRRFVSAGLAGIDIDDQVTEACPYLPIERTLISPDEMARKLKAAREVAPPEFFISAKASVLNTIYERDGSYRDEFARRAEAYIEAGADTVFTGWRTVEDLEFYATTIQNLGKAPVAVMGPFLPQVKATVLESMGYSVALYTVDTLYAAVRAQMHVIDELRRHGDSTTVLDEMIDHDDFMALVGIDALRRLLPPSEES